MLQAVKWVWDYILCDVIYGERALSYGLIKRSDSCWLRLLINMDASFKGIKTFTKVFNFKFNSWMKVVHIL